MQLFVWPGLRHATPYTEVESNTRGRAFIILSYLLSITSVHAAV
jgi:hypothetical protein